VTIKAGLRRERSTARATRVEARGKFLFANDQKLYLRGVTYGTFRPQADGAMFPPPEVVEADFRGMVEAHVNAIRTYTVPPRWLLDLAFSSGIYVMVGIPWEQHIRFLDDRETRGGIERAVRDAVRSCAAHPAVLAYLVGNEIPAPIVRWYGRRRIERWLRRLYGVAKREDRGTLVAYVNYPTTEYLDLSFMDLLCFNVYLETPEQLRPYLARLQNLAGDNPLVMTEIGLDSRRNGLERQAEALDWQVREVFAEGCAGAFVFAWTDEWHRGGYEIEDWDFGLVDRDRKPKPSLAAVAGAFAEVPFRASGLWPRVSVVVCSYNGARTIRDTLEALQRVDYPDFEVILVDDGSKDATAAIGREFGVRLISTGNRGLSSARNTGYEAATGEIVAYIDDDAYPDPHWLHYLAHRFMQRDWAGVGGPNLPPAGDGMIAECVANSPGGPVHVLVSDIEAEHIPGCNMAFRKMALEGTGGFDPRFRTAGDDVDFCWRLSDSGGRIGFHAGAVVWHHRRNSVRTYWKQQRGYGRAEALLERKWPERYNAAGHLAWTGRLYGPGLTTALRRAAGRIYQGPAGSALFQSVYQPAPGVLASLPLMPEWYLAVLALAALTVLGVIWTPLFAAGPLLLIAMGAPLAQAGFAAARATFPERRGVRAWRQHLLTGVLHLVQPMARLSGRIAHGLTPWRRRGHGLALPFGFTKSAWREEWQSIEARTQTIASSLKRQEAAWRPGGNFDAWDFEVRGGILSSARLLSSVEEHGGGHQLVLFRAWPEISNFALGLIGVTSGLALAAAIDGAWLAAALLALIAGALTLRSIWEAALATGAVKVAIAEYREAAK
jgi:O-antigen biosynthesis protein